MTRRFIAACENPHVNVIGLPTARRIGKRPPADVWISASIPGLRAHRTRWNQRLAAAAGPPVGALPRPATPGQVRHRQRRASVSDPGNMPYGVGTAQRGWLTPDDVINTWPLDKLRAFLARA